MTGREKVPDHIKVAVPAGAMTNVIVPVVKSVEKPEVIGTTAIPTV